MDMNVMNFHLILQLANFVSTSELYSICHVRRASLMSPDDIRTTYSDTMSHTDTDRQTDGRTKRALTNMTCPALRHVCHHSGVASLFHDRKSMASWRRQKHNHVHLISIPVRVLLKKRWSGKHGSGRLQERIQR